jgi:NAD(P)H dehydrogenase (quinone)
VLPPFVVYSADRLDEAGFEPVVGRLRARMRMLATTPPIPYRRQNCGDYLIPNMQLHPGLGGAGATGFGLHLNKANATGQADDEGDRSFVTSLECGPGEPTC